MLRYKIHEKNHMIFTEREVTQSIQSVYYILMSML